MIQRDSRSEGRLRKHEGQFAPPKLSGRSPFRDGAFAGRCGNETDRRFRALAADLLLLLFVSWLATLVAGEA
jgi:hypothetical protein